MGIRKNEQRANSLPLRNVSDFFTIPLEDDYSLSMETLESCIDKKKSRRAGWFFPELTLLSFKDGMAEIANRLDNVSFTLCMKVEPGKVQVSCSCGEQAGTLCLHSFNALYRLVRYDGLNSLKLFVPNGAAQIIAENRKYFERKPGLRYMFKSRAALCSVYGINDEMVDFNIADVLALPAKELAKASINKTVMCYIIMYSRRNDHLPFFLPCLGKLNRAGDSIKNFGNFLSGVQKEYDALLTDDQRTLNSVALDINKQVAKLPHELIHEAMSYDEPDNLIHVFNLWQKAIHLLEKQHCYLYPYFHKRYLKGKPWRSYIEKINVRQAAPVIEFKLTDKGDFYQLELKPVIQGKTIARYNVPDTFFIGQGDTIYMLSSLRDAAIVEWMEKSGNKITVFKKQFAQFESEFLQPLEKHYPVKR